MPYFGPGAAASSDSTSGSGPYFLDFARRAKTATAIPVMATGGFKTRQQAVDAVRSGAVDMVSVGRAMALNPHLARDWLSAAGGDPAFPRFDSTPPGGVTAWYTMRLTALAEGNEDEFSLDLESAMSLYEVRDAGRAVAHVKKQLKASLPEKIEDVAERLTVAYEPIWAIGTGNNATPDDIAEMHAEIRALLVNLYGEEAGGAVRILYGGSVKPENAAEILSTTEVGGALVGGASLTADSFMGIALAAGEAEES